MWIVTTFGFFSIVQKKKGDTNLTIRSRARSDLVALKEKHLPSMGKIVEWGGTDYQFRARATHEAVARALAGIAEDIDYSNFKHTVRKRQGADREHTYSKVWSTLLGIKEVPESRSAGTPGEPELAAQEGKKLSYGGVVFDASGRVLLRKVAGGFGGADWTFAKGRWQQGEEPEQTALREVREEYGFSAKVTARIPGLFEGTVTMTGYFVMEATSQLGTHDEETEEVEWLAPDDARARLHGCGSRESVKKRDLEVLDAALKVRERDDKEGE